MAMSKKIHRVMQSRTHTTRHNRVWVSFISVACACLITHPVAAADNSSHNRTVTGKGSAERIKLASAARDLVRKPSSLAVPLADLPAAPVALGSASALVMDTNTGGTVLQKNSGMIVPIASISKLMTAMVVLDADLSLDELISITDNDVDTIKGSHSRLPVGATMTRGTAMLLALMSSDNRAAHALARHYPGGMSAFVTAMNQKARTLGMNESRFQEPTGLSSNNVSTAMDLARMVMAAANYTKIRELSTTPDARIQVGRRLVAFHNTNALVRGGTWDIDLSKTGYISEAGRCLVMQARVAERPVVIVLLDSGGKMTRVGDAVRIKRWMEQATTAREIRGA